MMRLPEQRDEAAQSLRRAQKLVEPLAAHSRSATAEGELALVLEHIALFEREQGRSKEAIENTLRSLAIEAAQADKNPGAVDPVIAMARGHALLGQLLVTEPEGMESALAEYQRAVELLEKLGREHPELCDQAYELATLLGEESSLEQSSGKLDSALASLRKAVEILEQLDRQYPDNLDYEQGLAHTYNMISNLHRYRREPTEAIAFVQKAKGLLERRTRIHPDETAPRIVLASSQNILGRLLEQTGEPVERLRSFQRAVDLYESVPDLAPHDCYSLACNIAPCIPLIGVKAGSETGIDISRLSKGDQLRRQRYGDRAIELLRKAVGGGFLDLETLRSDTDLDPIRDCADLQLLIDELENKTAERASPSSTQIPPR